MDTKCLNHFDGFFDPANSRLESRYCCPVPWQIVAAGEGREGGKEVAYYSVTSGYGWGSSTIVQLAFGDCRLHFLFGDQTNNVTIVFLVTLCFSGYSMNIE